MRLIIGNVYQGRQKYAIETYGEGIKIKRISIFDFDEDMVTADYDVIIADEIYSGLTPIDENERLLTERYGHFLSRLAKEACSVERVVCGLAIAMK